MTIRYIGILTACVAVALLNHVPQRRTVIESTGNGLDLAIVGPGYFTISHSETGKIRYSRYGHWEINAARQLAALLEGKSWSIEPVILIPFETNQLQITSTGCVRAYADDEWIDVGQLQLARFAKTPTFARPFIANHQDDFTGPPLIALPGQHGMGLIQQYCLEAEPYTWRQLAAHLIIAWLASLALSGLLDRVAR